MYICILYGTIYIYIHVYIYTYVCIYLYKYICVYASPGVYLDNAQFPRFPEAWPEHKTVGQDHTDYVRNGYAAPQICHF